MDETPTLTDACKRQVPTVVVIPTHLDAEHVWGVKSASDVSTLGAFWPLVNAISMTGRSLGLASKHNALAELPVERALESERLTSMRNAHALACRPPAPPALHRRSLVTPHGVAACDALLVDGLGDCAGAALGGATLLRNGWMWESGLVCVDCSVVFTHCYAAGMQ